MSRAVDIAAEDRPRDDSAPAVARRVVLLGASNLTKSIGTVIDTAAGIWNGPLDVLTALGHGRSYGRASRFFALELPGIEACGLWADLASEPMAPATAALLTDIGNDLLYEEPVERISGWVERCLDRLAEAGARTVVTALPLGNLPALSRGRFHLLRTLFFPNSRIGLTEVLKRAEQLDRRVRDLALARGCRVAEHDAGWYGFDPIHIRFRVRPRAWRNILRGWTDDDAPFAPAGRALVRTLYLRTRTPERRRFFGFEQRGRRPSARLKGGIAVAIY